MMVALVSGMDLATRLCQVRDGLVTLVFILLAIFGNAACRAAEATPSEMYAQALRIEQETEVLRRHFKLGGKAAYQAVSGDMKPRHIRAESYILLFKLGKLRRKLGLTYIQPAGSEPSLDNRPGQPWGTLQRILTEIQIIKFYLGMPTPPPVAASVSGKQIGRAHV
jgi:hypothetical protein